MTEHTGATAPPAVVPRLERPRGAPPLYAQDGKGYEAIVHAHYFIGGSDWLVTEYDPDEGLAFGWACLNGDRQNAELGYVSLVELEEVRAPLTVRFHEGDSVTEQTVPRAVAVERDLDWRDGLTIREGIAELDLRQGRSRG